MSGRITLIAASNTLHVFADEDPTAVVIEALVVGLGLPNHKITIQAYRLAAVIENLRGGMALYGHRMEVIDWRVTK